MALIRQPFAAFGLVCLLIAGCGQTQTAPAAKPAAAKPAAAAPIDWLPADALAVVHIHVARLLAAPLPPPDDEISPEQRTVMSRTRTVLIAAALEGEEQAVAAVLVGDYDAQINPLTFATGPAKRMDDPSGELWLAGEYLWLHTPEGYW